MKYKQLLAAGSIVLATAVFAHAQQPNIVVGGTDAELRAFISYYVGAPDDETFVTIGSLPDAIPFDMPLPTETTIFGGINRPSGFSGPGSQFIEVFAETTTSAPEVTAFYEAALTSPVWRKSQSSVTPPSGFSAFTSASGTYCYNEGEASLNFDVYGAVGEPMRMGLRVMIPADAYQCGEMTDVPYFDPVVEVIPALSPVAGATVKPESTSTNSYAPTIGIMNAALTLDVPLTSAFTAYTTQLEAAGWELLSSDVQDTTGISQWRIVTPTNGEWQGTFTMFQAGNNPAQYRAVIVVEQLANID